MALHLHRAVRTDVLAHGLGEALASPREDPFGTDVVVVPARGTERWLSQQLATQLGVCAGVEFRAASSLIAEVLGIVDRDPWSAERLTWPLLGVLDAVIGEPWAAVIARHLGVGLAGEEGELRQGRRLGLARRLARIFASYATQRPALLAAWSAGRDEDGLGLSLPEDLTWQPALWRRLVDAVDAPTPIERQSVTIAGLRESAAGGLPARISLFGYTRLAAAEIDLIGALGLHREVHLWLPHPSNELWDALGAEIGGQGPVVRATDLSHREVRHPLLETWGRDVREVQRSLSAVSMIDEPLGVQVGRPATVLGWLQSDIEANRAPSPQGRVREATDRSVQLHAAHGQARQVEVLREVILGLLADDPTLEPRDILVMCPDIEAFAPLIEATFGLGQVVGEQAHPGHQLRVRLADRSLEQTNTLMAVASTLLELAGGRAGANEVLELAHSPAVRRRFGFRDDDLDQLADWVLETGVRWGFDAAHRSPFGLNDFAANTWQFGIDRLLTGVALSDDASAWLDSTLPLDDIGSGAVDLVGRLTEFIARSRTATDALVGPQPVGQWIDALMCGVDALTSVAPADVGQRAELVRVFEGVREAASDHVTGDLRIADVRAMLADRLAGRPTRANFRSGALTIATMVPMRSVPHRVVAVLGLDDGVFPRGDAVDGDNVLARTPMTGERDPRTEDRQLLLDALMSATETFVVTWTGADIHTGQRRPPAVPVGELCDVLDRTATTTTEVPLSGHLVVAHPLQPFSALNFEPGALGRPEPFTFDNAVLPAARASISERHAAAPLLDSALPVRLDDVNLEELLSFWKNPVRGFFSQGLQVALPHDTVMLDASLPVDLDNLEQWHVGDRILGDMLRGVHPDQAKQREFRRGVVPPKWLGWRLLDGIVANARPVGAEALGLRSGHQPTLVDVAVDLGGGRSLRGTVDDVYGDRVVRAHYSRLAPTHRLQTWIRLLALSAFNEDRAWSGRTLGRAGGSRGTAVLSSQLGPLDHTARDLLRDLVELRDLGLSKPLPLPLKSSLTYARQTRTNVDHSTALFRAGSDWTGGRFDGENADPAHVAVWGRAAQLPEPAEFAELSLRLWSPLLQAEQGSW